MSDQWTRKMVWGLTEQEVLGWVEEVEGGEIGTIKIA